jgi:hypothetical protein
MAKLRNLVTGGFALASILCGLGIILLALHLHHGNNDYMVGTCTVVSCNRTTVVCGDDLCYETTIKFSFDDQVGVYYATNTFTDDSDHESGCPDSGASIKCYYHNSNTIEESLSLRSLANTYRSDSAVWGIWILCLILACLLFVALTSPCMNCEGYDRDIECGCCVNYTKM